MFNRYWRSYPWGLRLALALLLVFTLISFSTYLILILGPKISGLSFKDLTKVTEKSPPGTIRASLITQALASLGAYALPAVLYAVFSHPRPRGYLGLRAPGSPLHFPLAAAIVLGMLPVLLVGESWLRAHMNLGPEADKEQAVSTQLVKGWMSLRGNGSLPLLLTVLALVPALGEELLFRGVFLRLFHQRFKRKRNLLAPSEPAEIQPDIQRSMLLPVLITSIMFTAMHSGPYSFAFIFIAGCVLALIYQLTGSLLCSIWAHFIYNGTQVLMSYYSLPGGEAELPVWTGVAGLGLFLLAFYGLIRMQTPLAPDWSADFSRGEDAPIPN